MENVVPRTVIVPFAGDRQPILPARYGHMLGREPRECDRDAIALIAGTLDVVGRVGVPGRWGLGRCSPVPCGSESDGIGREVRQLVAAPCGP